MLKWAIIMAAGSGRRMAPLTEKVPKAMVNILPDSVESDCGRVNESNVDADMSIIVREIVLVQCWNLIRIGMLIDTDLS
jgi:CTP:phosphocholine cytidylyltransferase-like protein